MDARVVDNPGAKRFELNIGDSMAVAYYRIEDGRVVLLHTEVYRNSRDKGLARSLLKVCSSRSLGPTAGQRRARRTRARSPAARRPGAWHAGCGPRCPTPRSGRRDSVAPTGRDRPRSGSRGHGSYRSRPGTPERRPAGRGISAPPMPRGQAPICRLPAHDGWPEA